MSQETSLQCPQCERVRPPGMGMSPDDETSENIEAKFRKVATWNKSINEHGKCPVCVEEEERGRQT